MIGVIVCASLAAVDGDTVKCDGQNLRDMGARAMKRLVREVHDRISGGQAC